MSFKEKASFTLISIVLLSILSLYITYFNNPFILDDMEQILYNTKLHNLLNFKNVIFCDNQQIRLFQNISFAIDWTISGSNPWAGRLQNIFWCLIDILLFFKIIDLFHPLKIIEKLLLLTLFLGMPIQFESIHYLMARDTLIQTFFYLILSYWYVTNKNKILISVGIILATLSNQTFIALPILFILIDVLIRDITLKKIQWENHYLNLVSAFSLIVFEHFLSNNSQVYPNISGFNIYPMGEYISTQFYFLLKYLGMFFANFPNSIIHEYPIFTNKILFGGVLGVGIFIGMLLIIKKLKRTRKDIVFTFIFFLVSWGHFHSIWQTAYPFAEHQYFFCNLSLIYLSYVFIRMIGTKLSYKISISKPLIYVFLILITVLNIQKLKNNLELFSRHFSVYNKALEVYPKSPLINLNLGKYFGKIIDKAELLDETYTGISEYNKTPNKVELLKNKESEFYQSAYDFYHQNPIPATIRYDIELISYFLKTENIKKACDLISTIKVGNVHEYKLITQYLIFKIKCLVEIRANKELIEKSKDEYLDYVRKYNLL